MGPTPVTGASVVQALTLMGCPGHTASMGKATRQGRGKIATNRLHSLLSGHYPTAGNTIGKDLFHQGMEPTSSPGPLSFYLVRTPHAYRKITTQALV